ncbi:DEAD/DEAH box helicase [Sphingomonas gilva]|uniref:DEAD/DEAH box helicase n=1 Tax=Sphingomonas gilva TaxID=2305907 RepID=UPI001FE60D7A|nr:DEAD/DEAH box helicase [Sphingomonas gilva]
MTQFKDLGLAEPLIKALAAKGYDNPTPIQVQAIPALLDGRDLCGIAQTGTGKTAAFALPSLDYFAEHPKPRPIRGCRMLVLSPTRELAAQIAQSFRDYGRFLQLEVQTVFGGVPAGKQIRALEKGCDVLVATPGRLLDLIDQRALTLRHVEIFVLDEADQMMDLGFIHALKRIDTLLPKDRQSLFFSATMPADIAKLAERFLDDPVHVSVTPAATTAERVAQHAMFVNPHEKAALLAMLLKREPIDRALVFTRTKHGADKVVRQLAACGIEAFAIHGNKSQAQRTTALQAFRDGRTQILIATDIAARGIDVQGVSHVFNYELPNVAEQYVHRIGRTARAGREGVAMSLVSDDERPYLRGIEKLTRVKLEPMALPEGLAETAAKMPKPAPRKSGGGGQGRGGRGPQGNPAGQRRHDDRAAPGAPKRRFGGRRGGVGAHKGAVKKAR